MIRGNSPWPAVGNGSELVTQNSIFCAALQRNRQEGHWHCCTDIRRMNKKQGAEGISLNGKILA